MTTNMELLAHHVENWAKERGLDNPDNSTAQALKLFEEAECRLIESFSTFSLDWLFERPHETRVFLTNFLLVHIVDRFES